MDAIINVAMSSMKQQNKNKSASIKGFEYHIRSNFNDGGQRVGMIDE